MGLARKLDLPEGPKDDGPEGGRVPKICSGPSPRGQSNEQAEECVNVDFLHGGEEPMVLIAKLESSQKEETSESKQSTWAAESSRFGTGRARCW